MNPAMTSPGSQETASKPRQIADNLTAGHGKRESLVVYRRPDKLPSRFSGEG
jgi:hypothetical protein